MTIGEDRHPSQTTARSRWGDPRAKGADHRYLETMRNLLERRLPYLTGRSARTELIADLIGCTGSSSARWKSQPARKPAEERPGGASCRSIATRAFRLSERADCRCH